MFKRPARLGNLTSIVVTIVLGKAMKSEASQFYRYSKYKGVLSFVINMYLSPPDSTSDAVFGVVDWYYL